MFHTNPSCARRLVDWNGSLGLLDSDLLDLIRFWAADALAVMWGTLLAEGPRPVAWTQAKAEQEVHEQVGVAQPGDSYCIDKETNQKVKV